VDAGSSTLNELEMPWPIWLLRYIATGTQSVLLKLRGAVDTTSQDSGMGEEALHTLRLLVAYYVEEGILSEQLYNKVQDKIQDPHAIQALTALHLYDQLEAKSEEVTLESITQGLTIAEAFDHDGLSSYFLIHQAEWLRASGDIPSAKVTAHQALTTLRGLAAADPDYEARLDQAAEATTWLFTLDGNFAAARVFAGLIRNPKESAPVAQLEEIMGNAPPPEMNLSKVLYRAKVLLKQKNPMMALLWYSAGENLAREANDEKALSSLLTAKAELFQSLGNMGSAMKTFREAVDLCRKMRIDEHLSHAARHLGELLLEQGEVQEAMEILSESLCAAARASQVSLITSAITKLAWTFCQGGHWEEAIETIKTALREAPPHYSELHTIGRHQLRSLHQHWARHLDEEGQTPEAIEALEHALGYVKFTESEEKREATEILQKLIAIHEREGDTVSAMEAADQAIKLYVEIGEMGAKEKLQRVKKEMEEKLSFDG
jgi:tetratricopeptide (TPR) repeat protein